MDCTSAGLYVSGKRDRGRAAWAGQGACERTSERCRRAGGKTTSSSSNKRSRAAEAADTGLAARRRGEGCSVARGACECRGFRLVVMVVVVMQTDRQSLCAGGLVTLVWGSRGWPLASVALSPEQGCHRRESWCWSSPRESSRLDWLVAGSGCLLKRRHRSRQGSRSGDFWVWVQRQPNLER